MRSGYCKEDGVYYSKHMPCLIPDDPYLDVVSYVLRNRKKRVADIALIDSESNQQISYKELPAKIQCVAAGLHRLGIRQEDVVCIIAPNSINFPVIFLAILSIGAVATTTNPLNTTTEIIKQVKDSRTKLAFTVPELLDRVKATGLPVVLITHKSSEHAASSSAQDDDVVMFSQLMMECENCQAPEVKIRQEDTAALLYSSGTTGVSKGVIITHRNLIAMIILRVDFLMTKTEVNPWETVFLAVIPLFHAYGLAQFGCGVLAVGATSVIMPKFEYEGMLRAIERYKITNIPLVTPIILGLTQSEMVERYDLSSVRQVTAGAAPLSRELVQSFANRFPHIELLQGYGMTETTAVATITTREGTKRYGSAGILVPNMEAKVVEVDTRNPLPPNQKGEIWLRGPVVMKGYFSNEEATSLTIDNEGWLHSGDLGYFDEDGFLFVVDRLKELIKYNAFQVAPAELEAVLLSHPEILDAAVVPFPDKKAGQIPLAYAVRKAESLLREQDVMRFVASQVAPYKKVRRVKFVNSIPKSASGKILRRELVRLAATSKL